ncbi:ATP-binding protein [Microcoleus asticus]|uniref:Serine-protein kinase RsbW n=1 Tax=Microcoleus asticus IPMA8 TaxID=2563858 RepID=A0ABX2CSU9_9CYAN|nr:ATP-binding protein [Microcoleus asticus]NQE32728.1 Serine-protein kinase RsbW [Microcoleus asticus IPMA8]
MNFNLCGNSQNSDEDYSGIGIKLMGKIADELSYTRTSDGRNCLLMVKYLFQPVPPQPSTPARCFKRAIDVLHSFNWLQEQRTPQSGRTSNQPIHKISLEVNTDFKAVTQVLWWVEQLEPLPIPATVLQLCKLAAIEGFTNAVRHAHKTLPLETPIELAIAVFADRLEIEIWDWGKPFDLKTKLKKELPEKTLFSWNDLGFTLH